MSLEAEEADLAPFLILSMPDLQLQLHTSDALASAAPPSCSVSLFFPVNDFCKLPGKLESCSDRKPAS